jgi:hypothetical protein
MTQFTFMNPEDTTNEFWAEFPSVWPPNKWEELVNNLEEQVMNLPYKPHVFKYYFDALKPYLALGIQLGINPQLEEPLFGSSDDGVWGWPLHVDKSVKKFFNTNDEAWAVLHCWILDVYASMEEEFFSDKENVDHFYAWREALREELKELFS